MFSTFIQYLKESWKIHKNKEAHNLYLRYKAGAEFTHLFLSPGFYRLDGDRRPFSYKFIEGKAIYKCITWNTDGFNGWVHTANFHLVSLEGKNLSNCTFDTFLDLFKRYPSRFHTGRKMDISKIEIIYKK